MILFAVLFHFTFSFYHLSFGLTFGIFYSLYNYLQQNTVGVFIILSSKDLIWKNNEHLLDVIVRILFSITNERVLFLDRFYSIENANETEVQSEKKIVWVVFTVIVSPVFLLLLFVWIAQMVFRMTKCFPKMAKLKAVFPFLDELHIKC